MSLFIQLIYNKEINDVISKEKLYKKNISEIDKTVDAIFVKGNWSAGFLESAKKHAIKNTLKNRVTNYKAETLKQVHERAKQLQLELHPDLFGTLQEEFPYFKAYELRFIRDLKEFNSTLSNTKFFKEIHNQAKSQKRETQSHFEGINKTISKSLGISEDEIQKEVYRLCFRENPSQHESSKSIEKKLKNIDPSLKFKQYQELITYAQLAFLTDHLSKKEALLVLDILDTKKGFSKGNEITPEHLKKVHTILNLIEKLDFSNPRHFAIRNKLIAKWKKLGNGNNNQIVTLLEKSENKDVQTLIQTLRTTRLNSITVDLIKPLAQELAKNNLSKAEQLTHLKDKLGLNEVTLEQLFLAQGLDNPNDSLKSKIFAKLFTLPDEMAIKVRDYLENKTPPSTEIAATILTLVDTLGNSISRTDLAKVKREIMVNSKHYEQFVPKRGLANEEFLDLTIICSLLEIKEDAISPKFNKNKIRDLHTLITNETVKNLERQNHIERFTEMFAQETKMINTNLKTEIEKLPQGNELKKRFSDNILNTALTLGYMQDPGADRVVETKLQIENLQPVRVTNEETCTIQVGKESIKVPIHIKLMDEFIQMAGEDQEILLILQTATSQAISNELTGIFNKEIFKILGSESISNVTTFRPTQNFIKMNEGRTSCTLKFDGNMEVNDPQNLTAKKTVIPYSFELSLSKDNKNQWIINSTQFNS